jgi:hypothetical protein
MAATQAIVNNFTDEVRTSTRKAILLAQDIGAILAFYDNVIGGAPGVVETPPSDANGYINANDLSAAVNSLAGINTSINSFLASLYQVQNTVPSE